MPLSLAGQLGELRSPPRSDASVATLPAVVGLYFSAQWYVELSREKHEWNDKENERREIENERAKMNDNRTDDDPCV
jgi:hypothetical protein